MLVFFERFESGIGPVCKTVFHTLLRVLAHIADKRKPRCREALLNGPWPVATDECLRHSEAEDRVARTEAKRNGHSHATAVSSAVTASGKRIGYVKR